MGLKELWQFFGKIDIPTLSEDHKLYLDGDITSSEVEAGILRMKLGKPPGPDGLTLELYRIFRNELIPYKVELLSYCLREGVIPPSWKEARLVVIPKKNILDL